MAETVQYFMERMVPDLEELENKGYFSSTEIKSIIKKRTNFEYAMNRRIKKKIDFLRSIEYEMNLEQLRKKRKSRMTTTEKAGTAEYSIHRRILQLFKRALVRFKGDVAIWMQYIDFAKKSNANKMLSGIFVQALQFHPHHTPLWIMAASWEFEDNANMGAARLMMQRALRMNPQAPELWHEYFRLELLYIEKIKARRRILGIDEQTEKQKEEEKAAAANDEEDDNMIQLPDITGDDMEQDDEAANAVNKMSESTASALSEGMNPILQGLLAKIIYTNAIDVISDDLAFRTGFVDIYRQFSDHEEGCAMIYETIERDMGSQPEARASLAIRHLYAKATTATDDKSEDDSDETDKKNAPKFISVSDPAFVEALKRTVDVFQQAVDELGTPAMWQTYVDFLGEWQAIVGEPHLVLYLEKLLQRALQSVSKQKMLTPELYVSWITALLRSDVAKARAKAVDATREFPGDARLWKLRIDTMDDSADADAQLAIFQSALDQCPQAYDVWAAYNDWLQARDSDENDEDWTHERIDALYQAACDKATALLPSVTVETDERNQIKDMILSEYVTWVNTTAGIHAFRTAYARIITRLFPTFAFYKTCLQIENDHAQAFLDGKHDNAAGASIERLFEMATRLDMAKHEVYLMYLSYLYSEKQFQKANHVYYKACKDVPDKDAFEHDFQAVKQGKRHFVASSS
ncbi:U3 small nucleolar RNA-associated protein 6-domain-containing protein [Gongronella butleri]|nr:U3 small nucleolar RNA-associated protein 6-domain-containing protein [Gongronella butleri]